MSDAIKWIKEAVVSLLDKLDRWPKPEIRNLTEALEALNETLNTEKDTKALVNSREQAREIARKEETDFLGRLREETIHHKEKRASFVLHKLAFTVTLFGLGSIQTDFLSSDPLAALELENPWLLFALPVVALAYDVYIYAEDYKVKRLGKFFQTHGDFVCRSERNWEEFVNDRREPYAVLASLILTIITVLPIAFLSFTAGDIVGSVWTVFICVVAGCLYVVYKRLVNKLWLASVDGTAR